VEHVGHAQCVFTMPKMLRIYFLHHRELLGSLSLAAYQTVKELMAAAAVEEKGFRPGMVSVVQTCGGFSVHNRVFVHPRDGREFEALVRYMMRPPVSLSRLHFSPGSTRSSTCPRRCGRRLA